MIDKNTGKETLFERLWSEEVKRVWTYPVVHKNMPVYIWLWLS